MPVVDASAVVDGLVGERLRTKASRRELDEPWAFHVPTHFIAEVTSALRGLVLRGELNVAHANVARHRVREMRLVQYPFEPFSQRVWELRDDLSVYDAWYVALAEALEVELVTADARLARTPGLRCDVRLIGA